MSTATLLILIGGGVLLIIIAFVIAGRISSSKRSKKLHDNIKKLKTEKEKIENDKRISLPSQQDEALEDYKSFSQPMVEDYQPEEIQPEVEPQPEAPFEPFDFDKIENSYPQSQPIQQEIKEDDFEKFMNEHSYSRKVFNSSLVEKIKKLPKDVRILLLSNVFDRFDDEK